MRALPSSAAANFTRRIIVASVSAHSLQWLTTLFGGEEQTVLPRTRRHHCDAKNKRDSRLAEPASTLGRERTLAQQDRKMSPPAAWRRLSLAVRFRCQE